MNTWHDDGLLTHTMTPSARVSTETPTHTKPSTKPTSKTKINQQQKRTTLNDHTALHNKPKPPTHNALTQQAQHNKHKAYADRDAAKSNNKQHYYIK
jgi:hypothetical protein